MATWAKKDNFSSLIQNLWVQRLAWVLGGCLWMFGISPLMKTLPTKGVTPKPRLQSTAVVGGQRMALIDGRQVVCGQELVTESGVFVVQSIEPGRAMLRRGSWRVALELPNQPNNGKQP